MEASSHPRAGATTEQSRPCLEGPQDEGIYCPICNYNLTGIQSGRCPECGALFDRETLLEIQKADAVLLMPWDDPRIASLWQRLRQTIPICLFAPERFSRAFSVQRRDTRTASLFLLVLFMTSPSAVLAVVLSVPAADWPFADNWWILACVATCYAFFSTCLTTLCSAIVLWLFYTHHDGQRHFRPWGAIVMYASAHYLLSSLAILVVPVSVILRERLDPPLFMLMICVTFHMGATGLGAFTLGGVIKQRTAKHRRSGLGELALTAVTIGVPLLSLVLAIVVTNWIESFF